MKSRFLGRYLRQKREIANISQVALAKKLSITSQFVSNWERGTCSPPTKYYKKICKLLSIPHDVFADFILAEALEDILRALK